MKTFKMLVLIILFSHNSMAQINGVTGFDSLNQQSSPQSLLCDTIFSFPVLDTWPTGIAYDGTGLWSNGSDLSYIYKYSMTGDVLDSFPNISNEYGSQSMVFDGNNLWVLVEEQNKICKIDPNSGLILREFGIPLSLDGFALTLDGNHLLTCNYLNNILYTIDTTNGQIINNIALSKAFISLEMINNQLYGISWGYGTKYLYKIDIYTGNMLDSICWTIPYPLDIAWDGLYLWNISSKVSFGGAQRAYMIDISSIVTSIEKQDTDNQCLVDLFPNPTHKNLTISVDKSLLGSSYCIIDFTGKHLARNKIINETTNVDISGFAPGVYFFHIGNTNRKSFKVIKD